MKNRFDDVVTVQYQKCCSNRAEVCDFVNRIREENPDIVFFRKEEIPYSTDESVLVTIQGWFDYCDSNSKPKKKQSKKKSNTKE